MDPYDIDEDCEVTEELEVLYSITPVIDEHDLSDLEPDELEDLEDEEEDLLF